MLATYCAVFYHLPITQSGCRHGFFGALRLLLKSYYQSLGGNHIFVIIMYMDE